MTVEIFFVLSLLVAAMVVLTFEWLAPDVVAVALVATLALTGVLTPEEAFRGFASEIVFVLASIFVLAGALVRAGVMERLAGVLSGWARLGEGPLVAVVMGMSAGLSAFISNTNSTAVLLPAVSGMRGESGADARRLLMPLAFSSMLGGACTLIGTSTNLAGSGLLERMGYEPISLFEFAPVGLAMTIAGIAYMVVVGRRLLPSEAQPASLSLQYRLERYVSELEVSEGSDLVGRRLEESGLAEGGVWVLMLERDGHAVAPGPDTRLQAGDLLVVQGGREELMALESRTGLRFEAREDRHEREARESSEAEEAPEARWVRVSGDLSDEERAAADVGLSEAIVMPRSILAGRTPKELDFRRRHGVAILAVHRRGQDYPTGVADLRLRIGDVLLLQGSRERLSVLQQTGAVRVLEDLEEVPVRRRRGAVALGAMLGAVVLATSGWVPLSLAFLSGVLVVVLGGCVTAEEIYRLIEWRVLVLIAGMTSFGLAMEKTGAAELLAGWIAELTAPLGTWAVLGGFVLLTMLLTQPMSNAAAALVVLPVALSTATRVGLEPRTVGVVVILAASLSFIAPLEPACLLVYGPGRYQFRDFVKVGVPLSALALVVLLLMVPALWPL